MSEVCVCVCVCVCMYAAYILQGACWVVMGPCRGDPAERSISRTDLHAVGGALVWRRALQAGASLFSSGSSTLLIGLIGPSTVAPGRLRAPE